MQAVVIEESKIGNINPWYAFISHQRDYDIRLSSIAAL
jgi:hypothetical protein